MATKSLFKSGLKALQSEKPNSSISFWIERLCAEPGTELGDGLIELVNSINLQATGPAEAARAIRKKLKYGSVPIQIKALHILGAIVENGGPRFQAEFANERLVERIRVMAADPVVDARVKKTLLSVLLSWKTQFKDTPQMRTAANLYNEVKGGGNEQAYRNEQRRLQEQDEARREAKRKEKEEALKEREDRLKRAEATRLAAQQEKADARRKPAKPQRPAQQRQPFNLEKEKTNIMTAVATASQACNALVNALQHVNRERESVETNANVQAQLAKTKEARKKIVRYTQLIENDSSGEYIGTLLSTNEQILAALALYDRWSKPAEQDSEDEQEELDLTVQASGSQALASVNLLAHKASRITLDQRETELDKLQERQEAEIDRLNRARAGVAQTLHPDLADLAFGPNAGSSSDLPPPIEPRHASDVESDDRGDGLSDYSDYTSEEDEPVVPHASTSSTAHGNRAYASHVNDGDTVDQHGLLDDNDPFADPFADQEEEEEVTTPGIHTRKEWAII